MAEDRERWVRALKKCLPEAEKHLDVRPFLSTLQPEGILNAYEYADVVRDSINAIDRVRLVFEAAERKEVHYIKKFVEIIRLHGGRQWADMISKEAGAFDQPPPAPDQEGARPCHVASNTYSYMLCIYWCSRFQINCFSKWQNK